MICPFPRVLGAALVTMALLPALAGAQTVDNPKLDETLRESVARGCIGTQSVIITVAPGYREGLRLALASHGDIVTGEFPAINAVAATVHCADLTALSGFGTVRAVSTNATVGVNAANDEEEQTGKARARDLEGKLARDLTKNEFTTLGAMNFRDVKPTSLMLVEADHGLTDAVNGSALGTAAPATNAGYGIGVAVIDSGIQPGTDFDNRITAFYDFTYGDIRAVAAHDNYGHGTHVAGLIGSEFVGVAPNALDWLEGSQLRLPIAISSASTCSTFRWAIQFSNTRRPTPSCRLLNMPRASA